MKPEKELRTGQITFYCTLPQPRVNARVVSRAQAAPPLLRLHQWAGCLIRCLRHLVKKNHSSWLRASESHALMIPIGSYTVDHNL